MTLLVTGATGTVGSALVRALVATGADVRAMSRSSQAVFPTGVRGVQADFSRPETLPRAFDGAQAVFLLNALGPEETAHGLAGVAAARASGVRRIVYLSVVMPSGSQHIPHFASKLPIERAIRETGIPYTILRANNFFQNDHWYRQAILDHAVYPQPLGPLGTQRVDVRDIADAAVIGLNGAAADGEIALCGTRTWTGEDCARMWSDALGREIRYGGDDLDAWAAQAAAALPDWMVHDLKIMYGYFIAHGLRAEPAEHDKLRRVLHREPRGYADFVTETADAWTG